MAPTENRYYFDAGYSTRTDMRKITPFGRAIIDYIEAHYAKAVLRGIVLIEYTAKPNFVTLSLGLIDKSKSFVTFLSLEKALKDMGYVFTKNSRGYVVALEINKALSKVVQVQS